MIGEMEKTSFAELALIALPPQPAKASVATAPKTGKNRTGTLFLWAGTLPENRFSIDCSFGLNVFYSIQMQKSESIFIQHAANLKFRPLDQLKTGRNIPKKHPRTGTAIRIARLG
jgi:hypothetical protein